MAVRFKKKFMRPGVAMPKNPLGRRTVQLIDEERCKRVAETGNQMLAEGILIPIPYAHTDDHSVYPIPLLKGLNDTFVDAKTGEIPRWDLAINAGFARGFEIDPEDGAVVVELEAEGDPENQETHAGRIGKTFKQTSPFICDWKDGQGKVWKDAPLHIALTNRAVQHGQEEFQLLTPAGKPDQELIAKQGLTSPELAIAMSLDESDYTNALLMAEGDSGVIEGAKGLSPDQVLKISALLKEKLALTLPDDTTADNLGDRLITILTNMDPRKEGDPLTEAPEGSEILRTPAIMSLNNPGQQAAAQQGQQGNAAQQGQQQQGAAGANAAAQATAGNPDDLVIMQRKATGALSHALKTKKESIKGRIQKLRRTGVIGKERAEKFWLPRVEALTLSLDDLGDDGELPETHLEMALADLEERDALAHGDEEGKKSGQNNIPDGSFVPDETDDMEEEGAKTKEPTDEEVKEHYERSIGR